MYKFVKKTPGHEYCVPKYCYPEDYPHPPAPKAPEVLAHPIARENTRKEAVKALQRTLRRQNPIKRVEKDGHIMLSQPFSPRDWRLFNLHLIDKVKSL